MEVFEKDLLQFIKNWLKYPFIKDACDAIYNCTVE